MEEEKTTGEKTGDDTQSDISNMEKDNEIERLRAENEGFKKEFKTLKGNKAKSDLPKPEGAETFIEDTRDILNKQKKYKIMIPSTERERDPVQVSINGYAYNIPRDKEVAVPQSVLEVLNNASHTVYTIKKRAEGEEGNELVPQEVRRFPYQSVN